MDRNVELFVEAEHLLGEGPVWDDRSQTLYWTDIERGEIHSYNESTGTLAVDERGGKVTSIALCESGKLLITRKAAIALYDPISGQEKTLVRIAFPEKVRFNDGKCDSSGRFYADSMDTEEKEEAGALFVLEADGSFREAASGFVLGNGLAWNAEGTILYLVDSTKKLVYRFDYCSVTGNVGNRQTAIHIPDGMGVPDGMCIDSQGTLWIAHYYGARVTRWNPVSGELLESIPVPAGNVTSCCFGGRDMKDLYITTSGMNLPAGRREACHEGSLFRIRTDVRGCASVRFNDGMLSCS